MTAWIFAICTLACSAAAAFLPGTRRPALALWLAGLSAGGVFLTLGAETLAVIQWILSTVTAVSMVFFSAMFGEGADGRQPGRGRAVLIAVAAAEGALFSVIAWYGGGTIPDSLLTVSEPGTDLRAMGELLAERHFVALLVLCLSLFLALVGGGAVARPERDPEEEAVR